MKDKGNFRSRLTHLSRSESGEIIQTIIMVAIMGIMTLIVVNLMSAAIQEKAEIPDTVPEPVPAPQVAPSAGDGIPLGSFVLVLLGLVLLGALVTGVVMISKKISTAKVVSAANIAGWQALSAHHNNIRSEWMAYETDILKMVDFPLLSDMSEPVTIRLHEALHNANLHAPKNIKAMRNISFESSSYNNAVKELDTAFRAAESKARLTSWNKFTMEEKKRLQRAKDLLAMAMDKASTSSERQVAYKQAIKTLNGLIEVPKATILALENTTQLALTA